MYVCFVLYSSETPASIEPNFYELISFEMQMVLGYKRIRSWPTVTAKPPYNRVIKQIIVCSLISLEHMMALSLHKSVSKVYIFCLKHCNIVEAKPLVCNKIGGAS